MSKNESEAAEAAAPKSPEQQTQEWSLFNHLANCHLSLVLHLNRAKESGATIHHDDLGKLQESAAELVELCDFLAEECKTKRG